ncbi:hypothetical protein CQA38_07180 [Campylobacter sp. MIT 12-5580]|nr:hypothetical protein CQA38_07180 [Campylobacter sp. MIT 12-5580]
MLTDCITAPTQQKLNQLQDELSQIYPCKIKIHKLDVEIFKDAPLWGDNYMAYLRLKIPDILPDNLERCLYLDVDMLALKDLRILFTLDLASYCAGVVYDFAFQHKRILETKDINKYPNLSFHKEYFCSAFMLLNLKTIRKIDFWQKAINLMRNYKLKFADQDVLNIIFANKVLKLNFTYQVHIGIFTHVLSIKTLNDESENWDLNYTRAEFEYAKANVTIYHYSSPRKVWADAFSCPHFWRWNIYDPFCDTNKQLKYAYNLWWKMALCTPIFKNELLALKFELERLDLEYYALNLSNKLYTKDQENQKQNLILSEKVIKLENENKTLQNEIINLKQTKGAALRAQNQLAYKLGTTLMSYSKTKFFYLNPKFYLTLLSIKSKHKKSKKAYENLIFSNPSFKLPLLETYADYDEALKVQNFFSYRLGLEFIKASKTWYKGGLVKFYFKAKNLKKEFKKKKV